MVADNGSTDGSPFIAHQLGARVINVKEKGYGRALIAGIQSAHAPWVVMGDSDNSYHFDELAPFVEQLKQGHDLVVGNRFTGKIAKGAMPFLNRFLGNPVLSAVARLLFPGPCRDFHCGLRAFRKEILEDLRLESPGMEFASEMIAKANSKKLRCVEVPITLHATPRSRKSHLRPWRDGLRHLFVLISLKLKIRNQEHGQ